MLSALRSGSELDIFALHDASLSQQLSPPIPSSPFFLFNKPLVSIRCAMLHDAVHLTPIASLGTFVHVRHSGEHAQ